MAVERTLSIVKPDATRKNLIGKIVARFEQEGLKIAAIRKVHLSLREAQGFYAVHRERPFFGELTEFMSSGPCVVIVLEGENAIAKNREIMGATNPANAAEGTLRKLYAASVGENAVHGSDSADNAKIEIAYFFRETEIF
jgi:nucleoside-diphosphate kinase